MYMYVYIVHCVYCIYTVHVCICVHASLAGPPLRKGAGLPDYVHASIWYMRLICQVSNVKYAYAY